MSIGQILNWELGEQLAVFEYWNSIVQLSDDRNRLLLDSNTNLFFYQKGWKTPLLKYNIEFSEIKENDILSISEEGYITKVHSADSLEIDIFVTNKCNSNCVMCPLSETVRRENRNKNIKWILEFIHILPENINYVNITGGEPTLVKDDFFRILLAIKEKFQYSGFQLLTNGRSMADENFLKKMLPCLPNGIRFAIPVHASNPKIHDVITNTEGSFRQTNRGIKNLLKYRQKVEIRIVVSQKNIHALKQTAEYIVSNYKGIFCVNFIAMEMMGSAAVHKEELWVDYQKVFKQARGAIDILVRNGIDVQLYNFPLCAVDRGYWHIAARSITDYKIRYMDECEKCTVKDICGGFFFSTKQLMKPKVTPIG